MKNKLILILVLVVLVGGGYLVTTKLMNTSPNELRKITVRLNWLGQAQYAGIYTAIEKGFYKDKGLDVTLKEYEEGLDQTVEVAEGKVEFGISTPPELIPAIEAGYKVKALAAINQTSPQAFVSLKNKNITKPTDFTGRTLGAKGGNKAAHIVYEAFIKKYGIKNAKIKDLDYSQRETEDIVNNRADVVDIYRTDQKYQFEKQGIEFNILFPENFGISSYGDVLITSNALIEVEPELVSNFVEATLRGWEYAANNFNEALAFTIKHQNPEYADSDLERHILTEILKLSRPVGGAKFGSMNFITWNESVKQLQVSKVIKANFDTRQIYTTDFINK